MAKPVAVLVELGWFTAACIVGGLTVLGARALLPRGATWMLGGLLFVATIASYWLIERVQARRGRPAPRLETSGEPSPWPKTLMIALGHVVVGIAGAKLIEAGQRLITSAPMRESGLADRLDDADPDMLVLVPALLLALVLAPVLEEALFRGLLFRRLMPHSRAIAWVLPTLLFAAQHLDVEGALIYVWLGLVFTSAYARTGRLAAAILVHVAYNVAAVSLLLF